VFGFPGPRLEKMQGSESMGQVPVSAEDKPVLSAVAHILEWYGDKNMNEATQT